MPVELDAANSLGVSETFGARWRRGRGGAAHRGHACPHSCPAAHTTLSQLSSGTSAVVDRIGGDQGFRTKMLALGLMPGTAITVVQSGDHQPLLLALSGSRFALDYASSEKIAVHRTGRGRRKGRAKGEA